MGSSFRSAVVFPGGALDLADQDAVMDSSGMESAPEGEAARMAALQICSLRETFEETGLLLLPSQRARQEQGGEEIPWSRAVGHREAGLSVEEWREWREKVSIPDTTDDRNESD
jgi:8-oxo-dGTP pyrophosphatase MutT (NUDIX family)